MQLTPAGLIFSATDLSSFLACSHFTRLTRRAKLGGPKPPKYPDPSLEALRQRGYAHETRYKEQLTSGGRVVVEIPDNKDYNEPDRWTNLANATTRAMRDGADVIYQGVLFDGAWVGMIDFLLRVDRPSAFGPYSYEVVDTKLARSAKGGALLQVLLYADLLEKVQQSPTEKVHLVLGLPGSPTVSFRVVDYAAWFRSIRRRFAEWVESSPDELPKAAEPVEHCIICDWSTICDRERRDVDHLSLVASITRNQRRILTERGITSLEQLALATLPFRPKIDISDASADRIHGQAAIQLQGRNAGKHLHELLRPIIEEQGLAALPTPSDGDLFFDLEGAPYALDEGIEYLFGYTDRDGRYTALWAEDRAHEKQNIEQFIDFVMNRMATYPDMHVYHYAPYEPTKLKQLVGRYATREAQLDKLLRGKILVDLFRVVRQGLRASVESYSIKRIEPLYGFTRDVDLGAARKALAEYEAWLELGIADDVQSLRTNIQGYNEDDCVSTLRLAEWLEKLRADQVASSGVDIPRPVRPDPDASDTAEEQQDRVDILVAALTGGVPIDESQRSPEQHARWLLAQLLGFHRREEKSMWWEYFRCCDLDAQELIEDRSTLGGLTYEREVGTVAKSTIHRYRFPSQEHDIRVDKTPHDPATQKACGTVVAIDSSEGWIELKRGNTSKAGHPEALVPNEHVTTKELQESLIAFADATVAHGFEAANPFRSSIDLLLARVPRAGQPDGASLAKPGESTLEAGRRILDVLEHTVLPLQGPPGAGKTYNGARMIVHALTQGKRVGVTAPSHKVIGNLLSEICRAADEAGVTLNAIQKCKEDERCSDARIAHATSNDEVRDAIATGDATLIAGTAWLWSREDMRASVDYLFVDEAGQFSLANALAVAPAAESMVLLGDPQQLDQPIKGVHPPGVAVSALQHLLGEAATIPDDRGLFLPETWRLHPSICDFTSEIYYDGRLASRPDCATQRLIAPGPFNGTGLRFVSVAHSGNTNESPEEVASICTIFDELISAGAWVDRNGVTHQLTAADVLIVSPYNAQVSALLDALPRGARVGTVDKFQGQEAPVVIYSMATSSSDEAPRGMQFLYNPHRLNVATSRARCVAIIVASPELFAPDCRTPEQMRLANGLCRLAEMSV